MKEKVANSVFVTHFAENYWQTVRNPHRPEISQNLVASFCQSTIFFITHCLQLPCRFFLFLCDHHWHYRYDRYTGHRWIPLAKCNGLVMLQNIKKLFKSSRFAGDWRLHETNYTEFHRRSYLKLYFGTLHYNDVIMGVMAVSNHQPHDCLFKRLFGRRSKNTSKLRVTGLCAGNSPVTGEFPAQRASNAEDVSIWWRHHEFPWHSDAIRRHGSWSLSLPVVVNFLLHIKSLKEPMQSFEPLENPCEWIS